MCLSIFVFVPNDIKNIVIGSIIIIKFVFSLNLLQKNMKFNIDENKNKFRLLKKIKINSEKEKRIIDEKFFFLKNRYKRDWKINKNQ